MKIKYILFLVVFMSALGAYSQRTYRHYLRSGDKHYVNGEYGDAIIDYKKALELNPDNFDIQYNLIKARHLNLQESREKDKKKNDTAENDSVFQKKMNTIARDYSALAGKTDDKKVKSEIYHNIGTMYHNEKEYVKAIEEYKKALRNNPEAEDTRYNLAHALEQIRKDDSGGGGGGGGSDNDNEQQEEEQNDDQNGGQQQQQEQQQQQQQQQQQEQQEQQEQQDKIERLMNITNMNEEETQEKVQKVVVGGVSFEKDW